jgi:ABC-2 type transport system permease protein
MKEVRQMRMLHIACKELKAFRDPAMLVFMLATPLAIMLILGTALSRGFDGEIEIGEIRVLYRLEQPDRTLGQVWSEFVRDAESSGVRFEVSDSREKGLEMVRRAEYAGMAVVSDSGMVYTGNDRAAVENAIVQGLLQTFADRYRLSAVLADGGISAPEDVGREYVRSVSVDGTRQPDSMDYYAVVITTMIILYSALTAAQLMEWERKRKTDLRLLSAPVSKAEIFVGKMAGSFLLHAVFVILLVLFSRYAFNADWGSRPLAVLPILFSQLLFVLGFGVAVSYLLRGGGAAGVVIMVIVQLEALFGGAYFPVEGSTGWFGAIAAWSPLGLTNRALLQVIHAGEWSTALRAMAFNFGAAALCLGLAAVIMRKKEGL